MRKHKLTKIIYTVEASAYLTMVSAGFVKYASDAATLFEAVKAAPIGKSFDAPILIHCIDENECDRIAEAIIAAEAFVSERDKK